MLPPTTLPFILHGITYKAILDPRQDPPLWVESAKNKFESPAKREWKPWKLEVGDIDGDGKLDLLIGIVKSTHQLHFPHTCLFIYSFDGVEVHRKWLSSTLGRPLLDFAVVKPDVHGCQMVFTLERTLEGKVALTRYRWRGFGLRKNSHQEYWPTAGNLRSVGGMLNLDAVGRHLVIDPKKWK